MTDSARVAACGSHAEERLALDNDDVGDAAFCEMIGNAGANASAPDDYDVRGVLHRREFTGVVSDA